MMNSLALLNENNNIQKNIYFTVGNNKYALPLLNVLEVMELPKLDYPQKLPSNIVGLLKFNNIIINVLDIRFYLDIEVKPYNVDNKLIIAKTDETLFGIITDKIEDICDFDNSKIERLPYTSSKQVIDAVYRINNEIVSILNIYALEKIIRNGFECENYDVKTLFPSDETSMNILQKRAINLYGKLNFVSAIDVFSDNKFVAFLLDKTVYCMNLKYVKEFTTNSNMIPLPCSPDYIEGLITIRGDFITVLNLKKFLNLSNTEYLNKTKVIIINSKEFKLGMLVDDIYEILNIPEEKIFDRNINSENMFVSSEFIDGNMVKPILNIEKILADEKLYIEEK